MKEDFPWNIQSLYDLQYFNCPSPFCIYKNNSKQEFFNHAYHFHPEADQYLRNINDGSTSDVEIPADIKLDLSYHESDTKLEIFDDSTKDTTHAQIIDPKLSFYNSYVAIDLLKEDNFCEQCEIIFCNQNSLQEHTKLVHTCEIKLNDQIDMFDNNSYDQKYDEKENYNCHLCPSSHTLQGNLRRHINTVHDGKKDFKCEECGKLFIHDYGLKNHIDVIHGGNKPKLKSKDYRCELCDKAFTTKGYLKKHIITVHKGKCETFKKACEECGKLVKECLMDYHKLRVHIKPQECKTCGKKFGFVSSLKRHMFYKHTDGAVKKISCNFSCNYCHKYFVNNYVLKRHIEKRHTINVDEDGNTHIRKILKKQQCDTCDKWVFGLEAHKSRKHAEKEEVQCDTCGKQFDYRQKLKDHVYAHHTSKEILNCLKCDKSFNSKGALEYHVKATHDQIKDQQCETCGAAFTGKYSLKVHVLGVHLGQRPHKCDLCEKTYKMTSHLKNHKKQVHDRIFDHVCSYCGKAFSLATDLKLHSTVVHEGIKRWKCDLCSVAYGQSHQLKKHYLRTHGKIYYIKRGRRNEVQ